MRKGKQRRTAISVWSRTFILKKSWKDLSMKFGRSLNLGKVWNQKRQFKTKPLLILIGILFIFNVFWFVAWLLKDKNHSNEIVATVAGESITREQWMVAMEKEVGRETLLTLVN